MKTVSFLLSLFFYQMLFSQTSVSSKIPGNLEFKELDYGVAKVTGEITEKLENTPTGTHGWLRDFEIVKRTDSILIRPKANLVPFILSMQRIRYLLM